MISFLSKWQINITIQWKITTSKLIHLLKLRRRVADAAISCTFEYSKEQIRSIVGHFVWTALSQASGGSICLLLRAACTLQPGERHWFFWPIVHAVKEPVRATIQLVRGTLIICYRWKQVLSFTPATSIESHSTTSNSKQNELIINFILYIRTGAT